VVNVFLIVRKIKLKRLFRGNLYRKPRVDVAFDDAHGTDTATATPLWHCRIGSNAEHGRAYSSTSERHIRVLLADLPRYATFLDLGCGKGRALIVAAEMGFKTVIGVEFAHELVEVANRNLTLTRHTLAKVVHADASRYEPPAGPLVVYLYNPFDAAIMKPVVEKLKAHQGELWVVYVNPRYADLFDSWLARKELTTPQSEVYAPGSALLWSRPRTDDALFAPGSPEARLALRP
jgi:SAM-dependent methyltransferase